MRRMILPVKVLCFLLASLAPLGPASFAARPASATGGQLSEDEVWSGEARITNDVTVPAGRRLIIPSIEYTADAIKLCGSSPTIPASYSSVVFYFRDTTAGAPTLQAAGIPATPSEGWASGSHGIVVTAPDLRNAVLTIGVTDAVYGQAVTVSGTLKDAQTGTALPDRDISVTFTAPSGTLVPGGSTQTKSDGTYVLLAGTSTIDAAGDWVARARFEEGDQAEYNDTSATEPLMIAKAESRLTMVADTGSISPTGKVTVSGQLDAVTPLAMDVSGTEVHIDFIKPDGNVAFTGTAITYDPDGHFTHTSGMSFGEEGLWTVKARLTGNSNLNDSESTPWDLMVSASAGYAILIQGDSNGTYADDYVASLDDIYQKLTKRQFEEDDILYLGYGNSTRSPQITFTPVSKENIEWAITDWAAGRITSGGIAPLYIILMGHGSSGLFHIYPDTITPEDLDGWLTILEAKVQSGLGKQLSTVVANGSCYSGSFIPKLSKPGRVIVTSGAEDENRHQGLWGVFRLLAVQQAGERKKLERCLQGCRQGDAGVSVVQWC